MRQLLGILFLFVVGPVQAAPVEWTLNDVTFGDGSFTSGTFEYDADTNIYSGVEITTACVTVCTGGTLNFTNTLTFGSALTLQISTMDYSEPRVNETFITQEITFDTALTSAGGHVGISFGRIFNERTQTEWIQNPGGSVSAVPVPAAIWLFGSGLGLLGWMRRKQTA